MLQDRPMNDYDPPIPLIRTGLRRKLPRGLSHPVGLRRLAKRSPGVNGMAST